VGATGRYSNQLGYFPPEVGISRVVVLIGLLLIALAAGFTADVFVQNTSDVDVDVLGHTFAIRPGWIVVAGLLALATFAIGARLVFSGVRRARRRRSVLRGAASTAHERDQLAQQLATQRERADDNGQTIERTDYREGDVTSTID
jgi:hypothetical protein